MTEKELTFLVVLDDSKEIFNALRYAAQRSARTNGRVALLYTFETPGGWNILGNTPQNIFDTSNQSNPNLVNPGDTIKFYRITLDQYNEIKK